MPGKIDASLNEKLKNIQWGEYRIGDLFHKKTIKGIPKSEENLIENPKGYHVFGQNIYYQYPQKVLNDDKYLTQVEPGKPIIAYTSSTAQIGIISESFYRTGDNGAFQGLFPKFEQCNYNQILFILVAIKRKFIGLGYNDSMAHVMDLYIKLPVCDGKIDFTYMDSFVDELKAQQVDKLKAYLSITGLDNYELTSDEKMALSNFGNVIWSKFNLKDLYGLSTRGKRLKSMDRINGELPFVTAGEANEGVSAFIGNKVDIFSKNTITIDMFGSAKFRNYKYGADDHIAVVHTEELSKFSAIFVTTAIHKSSYTGQFSYSRNFYAKDADELNIQLPVKDNNIDNHYMDVLISAIHKLVIKDIVLYVK